MIKTREENKAARRKRDELQKRIEALETQLLELGMTTEQVASGLEPLRAQVAAIDAERKEFDRSETRRYREAWRAAPPQVERPIRLPPGVTPRDEFMNLISGALLDLALEKMTDSESPKKRSTLEPRPEGRKRRASVEPVLGLDIDDELDRWR